MPRDDETLRRRMALSRQLLNTTRRPAPSQTLVDYALADIDRRLRDKASEIEDVFAHVAALQKEVAWLQQERQSILEEILAQDRRRRSPGNGQ